MSPLIKEDTYILILLEADMMHGVKVILLLIIMLKMNGKHLEAGYMGLIYLKIE